MWSIFFLWKIGFIFYQNLQLNCFSLWIWIPYFHLPFGISVPLSVFQVMLGHMQPASQSLFTGWGWNILRPNPCVTSPWLNASVSLFRLERGQREWKVSTSSAEKCFHGNCHWALRRIRHVKLKRCPAYSPILEAMPRAFWKAEVLTAIVNSTQQQRQNLNYTPLFSLG